MKIEFSEIGYNWEVMVYKSRVSFISFDFTFLFFSNKISSLRARNLSWLHHSSLMFTTIMIIQRAVHKYWRSAFERHIWIINGTSTITAYQSHGRLPYISLCNSFSNNHVGLPWAYINCFCYGSFEVPTNKKLCSNMSTFSCKFLDNKIMSYPNQKSAGLLSCFNF